MKGAHTTRRRMAVALLGLVGLFVSLYLWLYALGVYGALVCGAGGGCDVVQASGYARFLGIPVAGWGIGWYASVFAVALLGVQPSLAERRWPGAALMVLAAGGLGFSIYLTALELWVIHAICRWCVVSAVLTLVIFVLVWPWPERDTERAGRSVDDRVRAVESA